MTDIGDVVARLRRPEYTGENRCLPCTVGNLLIAVAASLALAVALGPAVGLLAFGLSAGAVYLRGYLIPGTPTLTERYLPARLLALFGKDSLADRIVTAPAGRETTDTAEPGTDAADPGTDAAEPREGADGSGAPAANADPLVAADVLRERDEVPEPAPSFRDEWTDRMAAFDPDGIGEDDVRAAFGAESVTRYGDASFVLDGNRSRRWESRVALLADVAAAPLLRDRVDGWTDWDGDRQRAVLTGLRLSLDRCPACGGRLDVTEDRVDPCCRKPHLVADSVCEDCSAVLADAAVVDRDDPAPVRARLLRP